MQSEPFDETTELLVNVSWLNVNITQHISMMMTILLSFSFTTTNTTTRPLSTNLLDHASRLVFIENGGIIELENFVENVQWERENVLSQFDGERISLFSCCAAIELII